VAVKDQRVLKGFESTGLALEISSERRAISRLYRLETRSMMGGFSRGVGDFYIDAKEIPCDVLTHGFFSQRVDGAELIPLDEVLLAIYRKYSAPRNAIELLEELRSKLPTVAATTKRWPNHLAPALAERGFRSEMVFPYGRTMTVEILWNPVQDIDRISPCSVRLGNVEFKPQPDRTLGKGRWTKPRSDIFGMILRGELTKIVKGSPINYFSEEGIAALVEKFRWKPISLLTRKELEAAKVQFIREHPELHTDLQGLAKAMIEGGLYSEGTQPSNVRKTAAKILAEMGKS
jgi:hypothetical protein